MEKIGSFFKTADYFGYSLCGFSMINFVAKIMNNNLDLSNATSLIQLLVSGFGLLFVIAKFFMFCMKGYDYIFIERKHRKQDLIEKQNKNELDSRNIKFVKSFDKEFNDKE